jgi:Nuclease-related domain
MADVSVHGVRLWRPGRCQPAAAAVPFSRTPDPRPPSPAGPVLASLESQWHRLDDLQWADPCAHRADHILVGPAGVFVIDAKSWPGTIDIGPDTIRHNRRKRHEVLTDIASAAKAIRCLLEPVSAAPVHAMLCFARDAQIRGSVRSVHVSSTANLVSRLASFPVVLDAIQSRRIADALLQAITPYEAADNAPDVAVTAGMEQTPPKAVRRHWIVHRP